MKQLYTFFTILLLSFQVSYGQFSYYFGTEQFGSSSAARTTLDTQANSWKTSFGSSASFLPYSFSASTSANVYTITPGSGYSIDVTFRDMTDSYLGSLVSSNANIVNTTSLQGNAPKPLSRLNEYFWNENGGLSTSKNAFLLELNQSFYALGFWVGDIETRTDGGGTGAYIKLIDASGNVVDTKIIETSTTNQALCGNPTNSGEFNGCGNNAGRWIGISNDNGLDIRKILVVVGDDDTSVGSDDGSTEHLSFMGGYILNCFATGETCNNIDDDCDGTIDEDIAPIVSSCAAGVGACLASGTTTTTCVAGALSTSSCNAIPTAPSPEACDNIDNDCDGTIDEDLSQATSCGVGACQMTGTETCSAGVWTGNSCIAGAAGLETCNNIDDDCDGTIDEDIAPIVSSCAAGVGACLASGTTTTTCVAGALSTSSCNAIPTAPSPEACDNIDNDCDGTIDEDLSQATSCGVGACQMTGTETCSAGVWTGNSCIAGAAGLETCNNIDDDCDGTIDEDIAPIVSSCAAGVGACLASGTTTTTCVAGALSTSSCNAIPTAPSAETCDNIDNDCDGTIDEDLSQATSCGVGACQMTGTETCSAGVWTGNSCIAGAAGLETCNNIDDDCDGTIDEDIAPIVSSCAAGVGACLASGTTTTTCVAGALSTSSCNAIPTAPSPEACDNIDNDCDGTIDEDLSQATSCGVGACQMTGTETCSAGVWTGNSCIAGAAGLETCNNIDDDCDGTIDEDIAPIVSSCAAGVGACLASGTTTTTCVAGALSTSSCNAIPTAPSPEACDNIDNDCDGTIDKSLIRDTNCGLGACSSSGTELCIGGIWTGNSCMGGTPSIELCNTIDDDCDGTIDEGNICYDGGTGSSVISSFGGCIVGQEICDSKDNDCDNLIDELGVCNSNNSTGTGGIIETGEIQSISSPIKSEIIEQNINILALEESITLPQILPKTGSKIDSILFIRMLLFELIIH